MAAVVRALHADPDTDGRAVLLVDDIDLLDPLSALVVHQIVAGGLLDVVATLRSGQPAPDFVRTGRLARIDLEPLGPHAISALLAAVLDGPVSSITVAFIQRVSAGNPLYVRELLGDALETGALAVVDGLWHLRPAERRRSASRICSTPGCAAPPRRSGGPSRCSPSPVSSG